MLFQIYGDMAGWQLLGWVMVFVGLVVMNEIARRTKAGGIFCFFVLPAALTVYFIAIYIGAAKGADWALQNDTYVHMNSWFHYAKLYAATAGCVGFMMLKYKWGIYSSKNKQDMLWPDMTWCYILAYDLWNFEYTYNNLPTHSWYCGLALLLAPTFANAFWNKGGWIQNRANTLALWCMFAQVFPLFQDKSRFSVLTSVYADGYMDPTVPPTNADPTMQGVIAIIALVANVCVFASIIKRAKEQKKNPYKNEIFTDQKDYKLALERAAEKARKAA